MAAARWARVQVVGAGVGNWDEFVRTGTWDVGRTPPLAMGVEAAGTVTAVAEGLADHAVGEEVLLHAAPFRDQGVWADRLVAPVGSVAHKPASVPWAAAATFPVPALTAAQGLDAVGIRITGDPITVFGMHGLSDARHVLELVTSGRAGGAVLLTPSG